MYGTEVKWMKRSALSKTYMHTYTHTQTTASYRGKMDDAHTSALLAQTCTVHTMVRKGIYLCMCMYVCMTNTCVHTCTYMNGYVDSLDANGCILLS